MPALYTALAILGLIAVGLILFAITLGIAFYDRVRDILIDFVAKLFEQEAREFANADRIWGEVVRLPDELRTGQRIGSGLGDAAYRAAAGPSRTHSTQVQLPSTRFLPSGEEGSI
jgi:hypothetical protein